MPPNLLTAGIPPLGVVSCPSRTARPTCRVSGRPGQPAAPAPRAGAALRRRAAGDGVVRDRSPGPRARSWSARMARRTAPTRGPSTATTTRWCGSRTWLRASSHEYRCRFEGVDVWPSRGRVPAERRSAPPTLERPFWHRLRQLPALVAVRRRTPRGARRRRPRRPGRPDGGGPATGTGPSSCSCSATRSTPTTRPTRSWPASARPTAPTTVATRRFVDEIQNFEEYTWLYHEAWSAPAVRWLLSTVPSGMMLDDHDLRDDWNTSVSWRRWVTEQPWWPSASSARTPRTGCTSTSATSAPTSSTATRCTPACWGSPTTASAPSTWTRWPATPTSMPPPSAGASPATSASRATGSGSLPSTRAARATSIRTTAGWSTPTSGGGSARRCSSRTSRTPTSSWPRRCRS